MRTHLTEEEFVDLLDGVLPPARLAHVDACAACGATARALAETAATAQPVAVPEPPPYFWEQLSARVHASVAEEPRPGPFLVVFANPVFRGALALCAVAVVAIMAGRSGMWRTDDAPPSSVQLQTPTLPETAADDDLAAIETDEAWALVRALAESLDHDQMDMEGVAVDRGTAEHLALRMTDRERQELARLIEEQLKNRSTAEAAS